MIDGSTSLGSRSGGTDTPSPLTGHSTPSREWRTKAGGLIDASTPPQIRPTGEAGPADNHGAQLSGRDPGAADVLRDDAVAGAAEASDVCEADDAPGQALATCRPSPRSLRESDLLTGAQRLAQATELLRLVTAEGLSQRAAALRVGITEKTACLLLQTLRANPEATAETFAPRRQNSGRRASVLLDDAEVAAVRAWILATNRTSTSGSTPEALRLAASRGEIRPAVASLIQSRLAAGQPPLPPAAMAQLRLSETVVRAYRSPRDAWLDYVQSPGSLQVTVDPETGEERLVQPGETWTIDDGSINLLCIVPGLERPGDSCWDRWGVAVGRFQLLVIVDHRTRFICGWSYTARPRDSYRAEDIVATFHPAIMEHGAPRRMVLEHGVSAATLVSATLGALGVEIDRASSPHQKVVESVFNGLWTRLSTLPGQVGRFRGEEQECNRLLVSIRRGACDPRGRLMELPALLAALRDAVALHNAATVNSERLGRWVPSELWSARAPAMLRRISPADAWMFSPATSAPIKVRGALVETSWQPMPGWTVKLAFSAEWLLEYHGIRVVLRYNPHAPECEAVAILAEDCGQRRRGELLGRLVQVDRIARMTRRAMGYGLDPDLGLAETRSNAQALRRHVAAVRPDGKPGIQTHEIRTGSGDAQVVETGRTAEHEHDSPSPRHGMFVGKSARSADLGRGNADEQVNGRGATSPALSAAEDPRLAEFLEDDLPVGT